MANKAQNTGAVVENSLALATIFDQGSLKEIGINGVVDFNSPQFEDIDFEFLTAETFENFKDVEFQGIITGTQEIQVDDELKTMTVIYVNMETGRKKFLTGLAKFKTLGIQVTADCGFVNAVKFSFLGYEKTRKGMKFANFRVLAMKIKI